MKSIRHNDAEMMSALYLQVSIVSQALIFVTRSRSWSYVERPGMLLMSAFVIAQLVRNLVYTQNMIEEHQHKPNTKISFSILISYETI